MALALWHPKLNIMIHNAEAKDCGGYFWGHLLIIICHHVFLEAGGRRKR